MNENNRDRDQWAIRKIFKITLEFFDHIFAFKHTWNFFWSTQVNAYLPFNGNSSVQIQIKDSFLLDFYINFPFSGIIVFALLKHFKRVQDFFLLSNDSSKILVTSKWKSLFSDLKF